MNELKTKLEARINQLRAELDTSAGQHNALAGRIAEAMSLMQMLVEIEENCLTDVTLDAAEAIE